MRQKQRHQNLRVGHPREHLRYHLPQQYICKGCKIYQQQSDEAPSLKHIISPSTDSESKHLRFHNPYRKFIHKQKHVVKIHSRPLQKHSEATFSCISIKRDVTIQRDSVSKRKWLEAIFDWMMEASSLLNISKNACYRSLLIFFRSCQLDSRIVSCKNVSHYVCAALSLGSKFQSSEGNNYLELVCQVNARRVTKDNIRMAECSLLETMKWKLPVNLEIESQISQMVGCWDEYLIEASRIFSDKSFYQKMAINSLVKGSNKCYIQVVYIIDYLVLKLHNEFLKQASFKIPVLMAIYMISSINLGDVHLNQNSAWPIFERFLTAYNVVSEEGKIRLKIEIQKYFLELRIIEVLGKIPLNLNFDKLIKKRNEQFYIPKIETNF